MGRMGYDTLEERANDLQPPDYGIIPDALRAVVRDGDVPEAALSLRTHVRAGGWIHDRVRVALRAADRSGDYADDQRLVAVAREAFGLGARR